MSNIALKLICSLAGLFGGFILVFVWVAYGQGVFASLDPGTTALKIGTTVIRAGFLLLCAWAAWRRPQQAAWFALGAFFAFGVGRAADEIFKRGLVGGFGSLVPAYYRTLAIHALLVAAAWRLAPRAGRPAVGA
jgi:hypothetical protein